MPEGGVGVGEHDSNFGWSLGREPQGACGWGAGLGSPQDQEMTDPGCWRKNLARGPRQQKAGPPKRPHLIPRPCDWVTL